MDYNSYSLTTVMEEMSTIGPGEACNYTHSYCIKDMKESDVGKNTAIALIRMVASILSILGTASIIVSAILKRQVKSPKVHPIFVLSIADLMLAFLWVIGGMLWLTSVSNHLVWCFMATLMTVILECVAINLTFVYALHAYAHITHTNLSSIIINHSSHGWSKLKVAIVYIIAWLLPTVLVMIPFGAVAGATRVLPNAESCACGCVPKFANVLPFPAKPRRHINEQYMIDIAKVDLCFSVVIALHYLIVFPLLVLYYCRVLRHIKKLKRDHEGHTVSPLYGATEALIVKGHSRAKHRVFMFLTVFVITGFCNLVLALILTVTICVSLATGVDSDNFKSHVLKSSLKITLLIQSITVPLQGFLNAIVYGWTREDFLYIMASTKRHTPLNEPQINDIDVPALGEHDGLLSDLETSSNYESDSEPMYHNRYRRQQTPETNLSGNW